NRRGADRRRPSRRRRADGAASPPRRRGTDRHGSASAQRAPRCARASGPRQSRERPRLSRGNGPDPREGASPRSLRPVPRRFRRSSARDRGPAGARNRRRAAPRHRRRTRSGGFRQRAFGRCRAAPSEPQSLAQHRGTDRCTGRLARQCGGAHRRALAGLRQRRRDRLYRRGHRPPRRNQGHGCFRSAPLGQAAARYGAPSNRRFHPRAQRWNTRQRRRPAGDRRSRRRDRCFRYDEPRRGPGRGHLADRIGGLSGRARLAWNPQWLACLRNRARCSAASELGQLLALPQIAAVAELARKLRTPVGRPAVAASADQDIQLWVNARPEGDEIALSLEGWTVRPAAAPRLSAILGGTGESTGSSAQNEWTTDEELRIISLSSDLSDLLGVDVAEASGAPLTRILRLEEDSSGEMPLISALAGRRGFSGQRARSRTDESCIILLSGEVVTGADGGFAGFRGTAETEKDAAAAAAVARQPTGYDQALEQLLRLPIDRIIDSAEQIVARSDGPLRADYASYGNDIASAARHLLSVLRAMSEDSAHVHGFVDLASLAAEAVIMLES